MPWLPKPPYLIESSDLAATEVRLAALGFRTIATDAPVDGDAADQLLIDLTARLGFNPAGAGNWAAFNDRLWDLLHAEGEPPVAIVIRGSDRLKDHDLHTFVRCVHNLLSMTEAVGLSDDRADLQVVYFFVGAWGTELAFGQLVGRE
jgi:hypothetical protein